jgi:ketosteroid isomerase-like protein
MTDGGRLQLVRGVYEAFAAGDRQFVEAAFSEDFRFSSPLDVGLDRSGYFERCWPGAGGGQEFEFVRLIEFGDEVLATYVLKHPDGRRGCNTEILTFRDERICEVEVYFGWDIE